MALGFTSHYSNSDQQPFGSLIISSSENENETAGSVACGESDAMGSLFTNEAYDSCIFSVSVNIDYSQYSSVVSTDSSETAGSIAYSGGFSESSGGSVSCGGSFSSAGSCSSGGGCSASFTC